MRRNESPPPKSIRDEIRDRRRVGKREWNAERKGGREEETEGTKLGRSIERGN